MDWTKVGGLILSAVSAVATLGMYVVVRDIRIAILTERDAMKTWVEVKIGLATAAVKEQLRAEARR
jgi:hydrogenase maturation factor